VSVNAKEYGSILHIDKSKEKSETYADLRYIAAKYVYILS
jgi:hypothetical protein